jgi:hypothetical protein
MGLYEDQMKAELAVWQDEMKKSPSFVNRISKDLQVRINRVIPEKVHKVITSAIETMTRGVDSIFQRGKRMRWKR